MQQFYALFKKEFGSYFQGCFVYAIVFMYLLISAGAAFYASYLDMHDTALFSVFDMQLYIQAALIPALCMRLWSEEYKTGTAEFLLTQPLKYYQPVLAKFCAAFIFAVLMSLLLLPFIHITSLRITVDWGNIACCYIGLWLVIFVFCAIGAFISASSKNIIAVYLLSAFVMSLCTVISATYFRTAYTNFLLAEIGIGDVLYFILLGSSIIFLNVTVLEMRASAQKKKSLYFSGYIIALLTGVMAFCATVYMLFPTKYDLTAYDNYTLQTATKEVIKEIQDPLTIDVYVSKDYVKHNVEYAQYYEQVVRFLRKYEKQSNKRIKINFSKVAAFSQLEKFVLASGLYYEENVYGTKDYFGAIVHNDNGEGVTIKHFLPARSPYLEKDIDIALLKLSNRSVLKTIGVYMDPFQNLNGFEGVLLNLENDYTVVNIPEDIYEISPRLNLIVLINPKELPLSFKYALDQYLMRGGKIIMLFDIFTANQSESVNTQLFSLLEFIDSWGLKFSMDLVDSGTVADEFKVSELPLTVYRAVEFSTENKQLQATPVITHNDKTLAVLLQGRFTSLYEQNPNNSSLSEKMIPHILFSANTAQVAVFGDVDFLLDENWISESAPDKNLYDAVYKAANIELFRNLLDKMIGNEIYTLLPIRYQRQNAFSISEQVYNKIYEKNAPEFFALSKELAEARTILDINNFEDRDKMLELAEIDSTHQRIAELELKTENLLYRTGHQYALAIRTIFIMQVILMPLLITLLLFAFIFFKKRRHRKNIREFMNE